MAGSLTILRIEIEFVDGTRREKQHVRVRDESWILSFAFSLARKVSQAGKDDGLNKICQCETNEPTVESSVPSTTFRHGRWKKAE